MKIDELVTPQEKNDWNKCTCLSSMIQKMYLENLTPFHDKNFQLGTEGKCLYVIKTIYEKPNSNIEYSVTILTILKNEKLKLSLKIWNKIPTRNHKTPRRKHTQ